MQLTSNFHEFTGDIPAEGKNIYHVFPVIQHMVAPASASVFVGTKLYIGKTKSKVKKHRKQLFDALKPEEQNQVLRNKGLDKNCGLEVFTREILKCGAVIKPGELVHFNMPANHNDPSLQKVFDDLRKCKRFRFLNAGKNATKIGDDFLSFGSGPRSYPGRWLAVQEIEAIISYIIRRFEVVALDEIKFPTGD
ncbi:hypothetical protein BJ944DRAFT_227098 [Cunninghamella echinulata]|nr:hypothetical protein BJ944DRAFT_227098 [Cunninghamella echinulata]